MKGGVQLVQGPVDWQKEGSKTVCRGIFWSLIIGYVVLDYSNDPEHCYATTKSEKRVTNVQALA